MNRQSRDNMPLKSMWFSKSILTLLAGGFIALTSHAKPVDDPISPVEAVSLLGQGILMEPFDIKNPEPGAKLMAYRPIHGQHIKEAGFKHVRIRMHKPDQTYKLDLDQPFDEAWVQELEDIIDDLLAKDISPIITWKGPMGVPYQQSTEKYTRWWGMIAERFQNKSHRLMFNLFIEPGSLKGHNTVVYKALTKEIRKTNPTRIIIYAKNPDYQNGAYKMNGHGADNHFSPSEKVLPEEAGIYFMWDFHNLLGEAMAGMHKAKQAYQYMTNVKEVMWCGAWGCGRDEEWKQELVASRIADAYRYHGMPTAFLLMYAGGSRIYDVEECEWVYPSVRDALTSEYSVWWNLLDNTGFDQKMAPWNTSGTIATTGGIKESPYLSLSSSKPVSQDITLALKKNGCGEFDVLGSFFAKSNYSAQFTIRVQSEGETKEFTASPEKLPGNKWSHVRAKLPVSWKGELKKAEFIVTCSAGSGTKIGVDKLGLTRFYRKPTLDLDNWSGEIDYAFVPPDKKKGSQDLKIPARVSRLLAAGNKDLIAINEQIEEREKKKAVILQKIYPQYKYPHKSNPPKLQKLAANRSRKNPKAKVFNDEIIALRKKYKDYFILNDEKFREDFISVYGGLPPHLRGLEYPDKLNDAEEDSTGKKRKKKKK